MIKESGHVEDRAKERTSLSPQDIIKARSYVKKNGKMFRKGQTYSIVAPERKGYYIVGDVGDTVGDDDGNDVEVVSVVETVEVRDDV